MIVYVSLLVVRSINDASIKKKTKQRSVKYLKYKIKYNRMYINLKEKVII